MFQGKTHVVEAIECAFDDSYDSDTLARVAWTTITEPGDPRVGQVIDELGAADALDALTDDRLAALPQSPLAVLRRTSLSRLSLPTIVGTLASTIDQQVRLLTPASVAWPHQLDALGESSPVALWVRGDHSLLRKASIAVTGGRTATAFGFRAATDLAWGLADRAYVVLAGGSYGIDAAAHRAALRADGHTVAVLASPVNELFPVGNAGLLDEIAREGALVSERPPCTPASQWRFRRRNQLLGALASKTILIESALRAGSLATAEQAIELGRPVGAVPGPRKSAGSAGCQQLIHQGVAAAITNVDSALALGNS